MKRIPLLFCMMLVLVMLFSACAPAATPTEAPVTPAPAATSVPTTAPTVAPTPAPQTLTVYAAASLTGAFGDIGKPLRPLILV